MKLFAVVIAFACVWLYMTVAKNGIIIRVAFLCVCVCASGDTVVSREEVEKHLRRMMAGKSSGAN